GAWRGWELRRSSRPGSERTLWPSAPPMAVTWPILPRTARSAVSPRRWAMGRRVARGLRVTAQSQPRRCLPHLHLGDFASLSPRRPPCRFARRVPTVISTPVRELTIMSDSPPTATPHPASPPVADPVSPPSVRNIRTRPHGLSAEAIFIGRSLRHALRDVESLLMAVALPVLLMLMFTFVFGGALDPDGGYVDYVVPGIVLTCAGFGAASTSLS